MGGEVVSCQLPAASQICLWPFVQRVPPGTHEPPHMPPAQTYGQAGPLCHAPPVSQVWGTLFEHWRLPGVHDPAHWPAMQTKGHVLPDCHSPADVQLRGTFPLQLSCPGRQTPVHTPWLQTNGQAGSLSQAPSALHSWGMPDELHCRAPGMHTPAQSPCRQT
jgi:hypothetical protein